MTTRNAASMGSFGTSWAVRGYGGRGNVAGLIGSLRGRIAVVCGNAAGVFCEYQHLVRTLPLMETTIFAVNDVGVYLPRFDHWVSLHEDNLHTWKQTRWLHHRGEDDIKYHSVGQKPSVNYVWEELTPLFALSGYFAMQIAYIMGAEQIILAGCPGSKSQRFFECDPRSDFSYGSGENDASVRNQVIDEMERLPDFKKRVKSMSGWTGEYFGRP